MYRNKADRMASRRRRKMVETLLPYYNKRRQNHRKTNPLGLVPNYKGWYDDERERRDKELLRFEMSEMERREKDAKLDDSDSFNYDSDLEYLWDDYNDDFYQSFPDPMFDSPEEEMSYYDEWLDDPYLQRLVG
jgi:hypothetical protein